MALSMEQVKRKCYGMGEKRVFNQYFFLVLFLTSLLPLHETIDQEPTSKNSACFLLSVPDGMSPYLFPLNSNI